MVEALEISLAKVPKGTKGSGNLRAARNDFTNISSSLEKGNH